MTNFVLIHGSYQGGWIWQRAPLRRPRRKEPGSRPYELVRFRFVTPAPAGAHGWRRSRLDQRRAFFETAAARLPQNEELSLCHHRLPSC